MTQEEKEQLLDLLKKADEENILNIYDYNDNHYFADWIWGDTTINIKLKEI